MRQVYHLITQATWEETRGQAYRADSLATEGFIHCSNADQVARSANRFYADAQDLLVLGLDADRLGVLLRDEAVGDGELFPHVHGPIEPAAVVEVRSLRRGPDGRWAFEI